VTLTPSSWSIDDASSAIVPSLLTRRTCAKQMTVAMGCLSELAKSGTLTEPSSHPMTMLLSSIQSTEGTPQFALYADAIA
jgi:hypothetical protein